jgi:AcrR family transcriptional regulator
MGQIQKTARRMRGRPQIRADDDTIRLASEAAAHEFKKHGYAGTSMSVVARRAGISTKTMYRLIPTKAALFETFVADRIGQFMLAVDDTVLNSLELQQALEQILIAYGGLTLSEETIALNRLVISECGRFPEIAATFYQTAIQATGRVVEGWLRRQGEQGLIRLADPRTASGILRGMMIMEPMREAMLGQRAAPDPAEITARARSCAALFLCGCRS